MLSPLSRARFILSTALSISLNEKGEENLHPSDKKSETASSSSIPLETSKKATKASIFSFSLKADALALSISAFTHFLYDIMNSYLPHEIFLNCLLFLHAFLILRQHHRRLCPH